MEKGGNSVVSAYQIASLDFVTHLPCLPQHAAPFSWWCLKRTSFHGLDSMQIVSISHSLSEENLNNLFKNFNGKVHSLRQTV